MMYTAREAVDIFKIWKTLVPAKIQASLTAAAELVKKEAEDVIGHPQSEWPALKDSTVALKERYDWPANAPLLREGTMKASIHMKLMPWEAVVYSNNPAMWFHETGTRYMEKRGVLSLALYRNEAEINSLLGTTFCKMVFTSNIKYNLTSRKDL